ncbi:tyrosine-type recombinase/integrase [Cryobacterium sp. PH31-AA6]|uniref:tyrosine-type recombinase/integrase n=1 Tax=Cryobacterium sp. PH31-AA6 TaxID=3046205 RepID=UPI0024BA1146|nr:tyrosine-type recombinase/integrase [Cryobacterium sp. PH31-AA6]MDJ0323384.1 tyrosine-type recombinase/integrase [Cryobacterium sp. PH31-AA6]
MGSIHPYDSSAGTRYRATYRKPDHSQGTKRGFKTKRDAQLFLASVEVSKARGEFVDATAARSTVGTLGVEWLKAQSHLKPSSLRPVEIAWRLHVEPVWGKRAVGSIRHSEVQTWVTDLTGIRGATTVLRAYGVLASILDTAVKDRRVSVNVARGVNLPRKVSKEHVYLSHDQVAALAEASGERAGLVLLLAYTGLRWGEAIGLQVKDLDMLRRRINVTRNAVEVGAHIEVGTPKSHTRRSVPFPAFLAPLLAQQCEGKSRDDLVFADKYGQHLKRTRVSEGTRSWFLTALSTAGLPKMTFHDLRHTAASLAVSVGANVKAVQRMLGHASAAMTLDTYADLFDDDLNAVADRLNDAATFSGVVKPLSNGHSRG